MKTIYLSTKVHLQDLGIKAFSKKEEAEIYANFHSQELMEIDLDNPDDYDVEKRFAHSVSIHSNDIMDVKTEGWDEIINKNWTHKIKLDLWPFHAGMNWKLQVVSFISFDHARKILSDKVKMIIDRELSATWDSLKVEFEAERN